jgi:hypothetical protein
VEKVGESNYQLINVRKRKINTMSKNKKKKNLTTKNTFKKSVNNIPQYDIYRTDFDREMDSFSDMISSEVRNNWKNYGVVKLNSETKSNGEKFEHSLKYKTKMFEIYGNKDKFFHITSPLNAESILSDGLKGIGVRKNTTMGNKGEIYLVESNSEIIWNYIGFSQLGIGVNGLSMVVLEIDKNGINGELFSENCNDYPSPLHTMVKQNLIEPKWIKKVFEFKTSRLKFYENRSELGELKMEYLMNHYHNLNTQINTFENNLLKAA